MSPGFGMNETGSISDVVNMDKMSLVGGNRNRMRCGGNSFGSWILIFSCTFFPPFLSLIDLFEHPCSVITNGDEFTPTCLCGQIGCRDFTLLPLCMLCPRVFSVQQFFFFFF